MGVLNLVFIAFSLLDIAILVLWGLDHWRKPGQHDDARDGRRLILLGVCGIATLIIGQCLEHRSSKQVDRLDARTAPRSVNALDLIHFELTLMHADRPHLPVRILTNLSANESDAEEQSRFAEMLRTALASAEWPTLVDHTQRFGGDIEALQGLRVVGPLDSSLGALDAALVAAHIFHSVTPNGVRDPTQPETPIYIYVGKQPF